jgi:protein tyrosine/serine phosphatase
MRAKSAVAALGLLGSCAGPRRFARVSERLYRGGQPSAAHLAALRSLGVRTIIDLRHENARARRDEAATARQLELGFVSLPFAGIRSPDPELLHRIVDAMADPRLGDVYVHCRVGRDRTSLVVALYRVWKEGWPPARAWQREARDFGYRGWLFLRPLARTFRRLTTAAAT